MVQSNAERLLERVVENRITSAVGKVREHESVLLSERLGSVRAIVKPASNQRGGQQDGSGNHNFPEVPLLSWSLNRFHHAR